jgi:hypothetical protein
MTVLDHDPVVAKNIGPVNPPPQQFWRVSKGDAWWSDRQIAFTIFGTAAAALLMAIGPYMIKK